MTTALQAAAQAVLDRWNSPRWEWHKQGPTGELMADLYKAIAQPVQTAAMPKLPGHPEPHTFTWTRHELETIEDYGKKCFKAGVEQPVQASLPPIHQKSPTFSDFIRHSSPQEKERVYLEVMEAACERQKKLLESAAQPVQTVSGDAPRKSLNSIATEGIQ